MNEENKNWEALEQALVLVNKRKDIDAYLLVKEIAKQDNSDQRFIGFIERHIADWLSQNTDVLNKFENFKPNKELIREDLYQYDVKELDKCALELIKILINLILNLYL